MPIQSLYHNLYSSVLKNDKSLVGGQLLSSFLGWGVQFQFSSNACLVGWSVAAVKTPVLLWKVHLFSIWCSGWIKKADFLWSCCRHSSLIISTGKQEKNNNKKCWHLLKMFLDARFSDCKIHSLLNRPFTLYPWQNSSLPQYLYFGQDKLIILRHLLLASFYTSDVLLHITRGCRG